MKTLDDYIKPGLKILSIGLNPSPVSVETGVYFAGKQNRFWKALYGSGLVDEVFPRSRDSMNLLLQRYGIGFTDTVKRPTPGAKDLRKADFVRDVPLLQSKILKLKPKIAWFHGKVAYKQYLSVQKLDASDVEWGLQETRISNTFIFLTPNPSPANAVYSLQSLIDWYQRLNDFQNSLRH